MIWPCGLNNSEAMMSMKKQDIIFAVLKAHTGLGGEIYAYGALEILPDGYGFLRSPQNSYLPGSDDIYISPSQIRLFNLKTGDTVAGQIRPPKEGERFFAMLRVENVNFGDPGIAQTRIPFDNLTPLYPDERLNLKLQMRYFHKDDQPVFTYRKGQRAYRIAPRTGKTYCFRKWQMHYRQPSGGIYNCASDWMKGPEEVTDMRRTRKGRGDCFNI